MVASTAQHSEKEEEKVHEDKKQSLVKRKEIQS